MENVMYEVLQAWSAGVGRICGDVLYSEAVPTVREV